MDGPEKSYDANHGPARRMLPKYPLLLERGVKCGYSSGTGIIIVNFLLADHVPEMTTDGFYWCLEEGGDETVFNTLAFKCMPEGCKETIPPGGRLHRIGGDRNSNITLPTRFGYPRV